MSVYIKYGKPDIKGGVTATGYKDWLEVDSMSFGFSRPVMMQMGQSAQSWSRGTVGVDDIVCTRAYDRASPHIFKASLGGLKETDVEIHHVETQEGKPAPIVKIKLKNALIVSYSTQAGAQGAGSEQFAINFTDIDIEYLAADAKGGFKPARFHFDVLTGKV